MFRRLATADWRRAGRLLPGLAAAALTAAVAARLGRRAETPGVALWGGILLVAFAGWGDAAARRWAAEVDVDLPLRTAWGMALTVAVGGLLALLGLARRPILILWTCGGVALAVQAAVCGARAGMAQNWRRAVRDAGWHVPLVLAIAGVTGVLALGSAGHSFPNPSDDWPAYLPMVHKLLRTGTLIEPFSVRRMAAYGGQTLLQAFALIVAPDTQIQVFDGAVCLVVAVGLVLGAARAVRGSAWTLLLLAAAVPLMLPDDRANSASELSAVVGFVALWRTIALVDRDARRDRAAAWLIAMQAAFVCTLRQNELPAVACMLLALALGATGSGGQPEPREVRRRFLGATLLATGACLAPWLLMALRSNHSFLFPVWHGYYDPTHAGISRPAGWNERLRFLMADALHGEPVHTMPLILLAVPALATGACRRAVLGLWAGTVVAFTLLAWSLPDSDTYTVARYDLGYTVALVMVAGVAAAQNARRARAWPAIALVVTALAMQVHSNHPALLRNLNVSLDRFLSGAPAPAAVIGRPDVEAGLQAAVPPGERLLVMIERPYLLDFKRNPILLLDQPGAASPPPGIPLLAGAEPTAAYLLNQGIRYFAFVRPDRSGIPLYLRSRWRDSAAGATIWQLAARAYLAAFDVVDRLAQTRKRLYDDGRLVVVDLAAKS